MPAIYISYRKEDTPGAAAHLHKNLSETFGPHAVFMDAASGRPGHDVRVVVDERLAASAAMLVIIGKAWADARDESGQRRLDSPLDLVRIETAAALQLDLPVIPVLVQGATMVPPTELPPDLADLAFRNPVTLLQSQWGSDVETLVTLLKSLVQGAAPGDAAAAHADTAAAVPREAARGREPGEPPAALHARVVRPQPVGRLPWRRMLAAMAAFTAMAVGVYAFMVSRDAPADKAVAQAREAAMAAAAETQAAKIDVAEKARLGADALRQAAVSAAASAPRPAATSATTSMARPTAEPAPAQNSPAVANKAEPKAAPVAALAAVPAPAPVPIAAPASARVSPARDAPLPPASSGARLLGFQKWTLNSGGCGAGPLTVTGTARFSIERTSDAVVVTEEFRGSGGGFDVVVTGQVEFSREQPSYDIPTSGQWSGANRVFKTTGTDRVTTSDGLTPRSANVLKLQSVCG